MSYCDFVKTYTGKYADLHRDYHDHHYGFPVKDDNALFERLALEINQAGLSWGTILAKLPAFRQAFEQFQIDKVAAFTQDDVTRLLNNPAIIRNRLKIQAVIFNAQALLALQKTHGSFKAWLDQHHPQSLEQWVRLFKKQFKFVGTEIVKEFLISTGYLAGAHDASCPVYRLLDNALTR